MRMRFSSRTLIGCATGLFLSVSVGLLAFACYSAAQQPGTPKLPEGLRHVPGDALGFVHVRMGDFLKGELGSQLLTELRKDREASRGLQEAERYLGMQLADVESVTVLLLAPPTRNELGPWDGPFGGPLFRPRRIYKDKDKMMKDMKVEPKVFEEKKAERQVADKALQVSTANEEYQPIPQQLDPREMLEYLAMSGPLFLVTSSKPLDRKKILTAQLRDRDRFDHGPRVELSVMFVSDRTLAIGSGWELARYSEHVARNPGPKTRPMQSAFDLASPPRMLIAGGHLPAEVRRMAFFPLGGVSDFEMRALPMLAPLLPTEAAVAIDLGKNLDMTMRFSAPTEASATVAFESVKSLRTLAELAIERSNDASEPGGWKLDLQKSVKKALAGAVIEQKGPLVRADVKIELTPAIYKHFVKDVVSHLRVGADRTVSVNNLKQIGLAMHNFHSVYNRFPAAGISGQANIIDPNGKPLLSWRVAILPFIEQDPLYRKFDLTKPWDHEDNKKLIPLMPQVYLMPSAPESKEPGMTHYRVLVGPQTMFEPGVRMTFAQITDGTSNTILAVEAAEPTIWTKPDDLPYDAKKPLPRFGVTPEGFNVLMGDGSVRFLRMPVQEEIMRALITRNGNEVIQIPEDR